MRPTESKSAFVKANASKMTVEEMAVKLGATRHSINLLVKYYGLDVATKSKNDGEKLFDVNEMKDKTWLI